MGFKGEWKKRAWKVRLLQAFLSKYRLPLSFFSEAEIMWMLESYYDHGFRAFLAETERNLDLPVNTTLGDKLQVIAARL